jgi:hypothetical protein
VRDNDSRPIWWLSFCDPHKPPGDQFLGVCMVHAPDLKTAIQIAWVRECNPGGEVMGCRILDAGYKKEDFYRILTRVEADQLNALYIPNAAVSGVVH